MAQNKNVEMNGGLPLGAQLYIAAALQGAFPHDEQTKKVAQGIADHVDNEMDRQGLLRAIFADELTPADLVYGATGGALTYFAALEWIQEHVSQLDSAVGGVVTVCAGALLGIAAGRTVEHSIVGKYAGMGRYAHLKEFADMLADEDQELYKSMVNHVREAVGVERGSLITNASAAAVEAMEEKLVKLQAKIQKDLDESLDKKFKAQGSSLKGDMDAMFKVQTKALEKEQAKNTATLVEALGKLGISQAKEAKPKATAKKTEKKAEKKAS